MSGVALVTTTINVPKLLLAYTQTAREFGHDDLTVYVVGDKKTPAGAGAFCATLQKKSGYVVNYLDVSRQKKYLKRFVGLRDYLPWNCIQRRNVGLLLAYGEGQEKIITIDDDNLVVPRTDYFAAQKVVGTVQDLRVIAAAGGWYNVCEALVEEHGLPFYHRGFPLEQRWRTAKTKQRKTRGKVVVNAGLWTEAPDIDALTWLDLPIVVSGYRKKEKRGVALAPGTWSPFNSQNTAIAREVIPAYFLSPYIGRYDDIWASYIVKRIADHLGHYIKFGEPVVRQARNPHNYFKDFDKERLGMEATGGFTAALREFKPKGETYQECYGEVVEWTSQNVREIFGESYEKWAAGLDKMVAGMSLWQEVFTKL